nr:hypothetical protein [Pandoravirus massiliensis]
MEPIVSKLNDLFPRLTRFLKNPKAPGEDTDFCLFLMENSGLTFKSDADLLVLREVYQPFWAGLMELAYVRPSVVACLPWPPTPKTVYRYATRKIFSGDHRPFPQLLDEWSILDVSGLAPGDAARKAAIRALDRIEEAIEIAERRAKGGSTLTARLIGCYAMKVPPLRRPVGRQALDAVWRTLKVKQWDDIQCAAAAEIAERAGPTPEDKMAAAEQITDLAADRWEGIGEAKRPRSTHRRTSMTKPESEQTVDEPSPDTKDRIAEHATTPNAALDDILRTINERIERARRGAYRADLDAYRYQQHEQDETLSIFVDADTPEIILREMEAKGYKIERSTSRVTSGFDIVIPPFAQK